MGVNLTSRRKTSRAFGEMVALLWAKRHIGATVRLEHLWNSSVRQTGLLFILRLSAKWIYGGFGRVRRAYLPGPFEVNRRRQSIQDRSLL